MRAGLWAAGNSLFCDWLDRNAAERSLLLHDLARTDPELATLVSDLFAAEAEGEPIESFGIPALIEDPLPDDEDPLIGERLGPYRIREFLGSGGMGRVYVAVHADYQGIVALKVLSDSLSAERRARFEFEKAHLGRLRHPGIAQIFHADTHLDGTLFFAMEYVEGSRITDFCRDNRLSLEDRLRLFLQVCAATQAAHNQGILHRDLKPSNILVTADRQAKLLDFGIAEDPSRTVPSGERFLSPPYAAPEQEDAVPSVSSDVYSLGMVLFELIAGALPFAVDRRSAREIRQTVRAGNFAKPSTLAPGDLRLSALRWHEIDFICAKATAADPDARYITADALARDIVAFLELRPINMDRSGATYAARKFVTRHRLAVAVAIMTIVVLAGVVSVYTWRLRLARNAALAAAAHATRMEAFDRGLLSSGGEAGPSQDLKVITLLDNGVKSAGALSSDPATQADYYEILGEDYIDIGALDRAEPAIQKAVDLRTRLFGAGSPEVARILTEQADLFDNEGNVSQAETLAQRAVAIGSRSLPEDHPDRIEAQEILMRIYSDEGKYVQELPVLQRIIQLIQDKPELRGDLSEAFNDLGLAENSLGRIDEARIANQQSLEIDRKLYGDKNPDVAEHLLTLADLDEQLRKYEAAVKDSQEAFQIEREWFGADNRTTLSASVTLGQALSSNGQPQLAEPILLHALSVQQTIYKTPGITEAHTLSALGNTEKQLKHYDQARAYLTRALAAYRTLYPEGSANTATALKNLAAIDLQVGRVKDAETELREALSLYATHLSRNTTHLYDTQMLLAKLLISQKREMEAKPLFQSICSSQVDGPAADRQNACDSLAKLTFR